MSISQLFLGLFLIVLAVSLLGWVAVSNVFLGALALVTGIIILVDGVVVWKK